MKILNVVFYGEPLNIQFLAQFFQWNLRSQNYLITFPNVHFNEWLY